MIFLGDASEEASVICRTLQGSAHIEEDFMERTNTEMYRISFGPGETEKPCDCLLYTSPSPRDRG